MSKLDNLIFICNMYKQEKFDIEEFSSRINTSVIPKNSSREFIKSLVDFDNAIERIIFCEDSSLREEFGKLVADRLIQAVMLEKQKTSRSDKK